MSSSEEAPSNHHERQIMLCCRSNEYFVLEEEILRTHSNDSESVSGSGRDTEKEERKGEEEDKGEESGKNEITFMTVDDNGYESLMMEPPSFDPTSCFPHRKAD